ncbi:MAG TPA: hypothetical protein VF585_05345 [Chthoniobacterales bacterium]|jgi:hypothetical protein
MSLPPQIEQKYHARFEELIREGQSIRESVKTIPGEYYEDFVGRMQQHAPTFEMDWPRVVKWRTHCASLLDQVIPENSVHSSVAKDLLLITKTNQLDWAVNVMCAIAEDIKHGFIGDLSAAIEAAVASDYLGQAESLLRDGQKGKYEHVPAAVLAGAVLEKALRTLCTQQAPPVSITTPKGEPKTMNPLIDDLKRAGLFNELKAKQLRSWADIRNKAAHGEFDEFTPLDVDQMIKGITNFLADYLS